MSKYLSMIATASLALVAGCAPAPQRIGTGEEWHNHGGDSDETGYSRLDQIKDSNVARLGLAWSLDLPGEASLQATPLAVGGLLYFTGSYAAVYAVDAATGRQVWKFDPKTWEQFPQKMHAGFGANRGAAYANGRIYSAALDGRLFALDAKTGAVIWSVETTARDTPQSITGAPRVYNDKVIIGQGGADFGARGYVTAYEQATGKQAWRFYVVPGSPEQNQGNEPLERAAKTWNGEFWKKGGGGGGPWDSMTFDAELNRVYVGTANAAPYDPEQRSPGGGDNLYTASIVALDADTGKYLWHYQVNPRDSWDYDSVQQMTLATLTIDGKPRKVLMQAPKNGFFYVIDRTNGKVISAGKLGKVTWADRIDLATGRPVERPNVRYETGESVIYPSSAGAHSWMRQSYDPATGLVYIPYMNLGMILKRGAPDENGVFVMGLNVIGHTEGPDEGKGAMIAWDPVKQQERWRAPIETIWNGGALATAGNLVFQGTGEGNLIAYDARTGKVLWKYYVGMGVIAAPITYTVGGKQYLAVLAGYGGSAGIWSKFMNAGWKYRDPRRLLTFALDGQGKLAAVEQRSPTVHPLDDPKLKLNPADVGAGKLLFMACASCHGFHVVGAGGPGPDLRESAIALDAAAFRNVVIGGALISKGMPQITMFNEQQIEQIRAYIRSEARAALAAQAAATQAATTTPAKS